MRRSYYTLFALLFTCVSLRAQTGLSNEVSVFTSKELYVVHAKLVHKTTGVPVRGIRTFASVPGLHFEMRSEESDSLGNLYFLMKDIEGQNQMIFQTQSNEDSLYRIEFPPTFITKYENAQQLSEVPLQTDTLPFYGKPDKTYLLDDYVRFPTMEEVIREYAAAINLRKVRNQYKFYALNTPVNRFFETGPLVLLDGVPVLDIDYFMTLDPLKIRKLDIVGRKYFYGSLICNGIVSFFTYNGDLAGFTLPQHAVVKDVSNRKALK